MTEHDILDLIRSDPWMMRVLAAAQQMHLPDWMIGAGFVRNKVWDHLHGFHNAVVPTADIDLVYFDPSDTSEETEKRLDEILHHTLDVAWSCKNEARMHTINEFPPFTSSTDAISKWPETATAVGVTRDGDMLHLIAPHGINDLVEMIVRPTPAFAATEKNKRKVFERMNQKGWITKWPRLRIDL